MVWRAAAQLGIHAEAATPAIEAGLVEFGAYVRFRHPLVRSAAYRSASLRDRQAVHRALAEVTDLQIDPDRRAWHRAQAASGPDEDVAAELERSASRAQARGGLAAAAAFLERAAMLTPEPGRRAQRLLAAARAKRDAGAPDAALGLLVAVEAGPLDALPAAEVEHLRGQIAFDQRRGTDAARLLLGAARRLEPLKPGLARETHLESLVAAMWADDLDTPGGVAAAAAAARAAPPGPRPPAAVDVLLEAVVLRLTEGYAAAAPALTRALELLLALNGNEREAGDWLARSRGSSGIIALELWDFGSWHDLAAGQVRFARDTGALVHLQSALTYLGWTHVVAGEMATAAHAHRGRSADRRGDREPAHRVHGDDARGLAGPGGTGHRADRGHRRRKRPHEAWAGWSASRPTRVGAQQRPRPPRRRTRRRTTGVRARSAGLRAPGRARTGRGGVADRRRRAGQGRTEWLSERTRVTPTEWALGMEARVHALLSDGEAAERCYRESIGRLGRTRVRAELARAHLLYGEWLRRERRRGDAREHLRTAHEMLDRDGHRGFRRTGPRRAARHRRDRPQAHRRDHAPS